MNKLLNYVAMLTEEAGWVRRYRVKYPDSEPDIEVSDSEMRDILVDLRPV